MADREFEGVNDPANKKAEARRTAYLKTVKGAADMGGAVGEVLKKGAEGIAKQIDDEDRQPGS